jgi:acetyl-CoA C-acetyltransferase
LSFEVCGRLWVLVTPKSASSCATSFERIDVPRSAWMVSCLAVATAVKSVLADAADNVLAIGVEVQNTVKAIYGADVLAGAGHYASQRKAGHAYFFPAQFSDRAGAYKKKSGEEKAWAAMGRWYEQAILNARKNPTAQEYHNTTEDLFATHQHMRPNPRSFCDDINFVDCSKVSDGAAALIVSSAEGFDRLGVDNKNAVELVGLGHCVDDLTTLPDDLTVMETTHRATKAAMDMAGITVDEIGVFEVHDCFTISGILAVEALGLAGHGEGKDYVIEGHTRFEGETPMNAGGGLVGWGHPTGASGVRMSADVIRQLTGNAGGHQLALNPKRPYGMSISMGGNDKTVVCCVLKAAE